MRSDNHQLPCVQPPTSLCTTSNFLMVNMVIMVAKVIMVTMVMVVTVIIVVKDRTGQDRTGQDRTMSLKFEQWLLIE